MITRKRNRSSENTSQDKPESDSDPSEEASKAKRRHNDELYYLKKLVIGVEYADSISYGKQTTAARLALLDKRIELMVKEKKEFPGIGVVNKRKALPGRASLRRSTRSSLVEEVEYEMFLPSPDGENHQTNVTKGSLKQGSRGNLPRNSGKVRGKTVESKISEDVRAKISASLKARNRNILQNKLKEMGITEEEWVASKKEARRESRRMSNLRYKTAKREAKTRVVEKKAKPKKEGAVKTKASGTKIKSKISADIRAKISASLRARNRKILEKKLKEMGITEEEWIMKKKEDRKEMKRLGKQRIRAAKRGTKKKSVEGDQTKAKVGAYVKAVNSTNFSGALDNTGKGENEQEKGKSKHGKTVKTKISADVRAKISASLKARNKEILQNKLKEMGITEEEWVTRKKEAEREKNMKRNLRRQAAKREAKTRVVEEKTKSKKEGAAKTKTSGKKIETKISEDVRAKISASLKARNKKILETKLKEMGITEEEWNLRKKTKKRERDKMRKLRFKAAKSVAKTKVIEEEEEYETNLGDISEDELKEQSETDKESDEEEEQDRKKKMLQLQRNKIRKKRIAAAAASKAQSIEEQASDASEKVANDEMSSKAQSVEEQESDASSEKAANDGMNSKLRA